jgi:protein-S-isoprenylcysteine O-methyltransferase Ste14
MNIIGRTTIHPLVFYSGKISGYFTWIILLLLLSNIRVIEKRANHLTDIITLVLVLISLVFIILSLVNLGKSTRLGLPMESTVFKTNGLYTISRNPMYVGFNLLTISAIVYTQHILIICLGIYSLIAYHLIILGEERFLEERFGQEYLSYKGRVRRYL